MKVKRPEEINNWLLRASLDCIKDETSLDIDLSACAPIPTAPNDNTLSDIWVSTNSSSDVGIPGPGGPVHSHSGVISFASSCSDKSSSSCLKLTGDKSCKERVVDVIENPPKIELGKSEGEKFSCKNCLQQYNSKVELKEHVKSHRNNKKNDFYTCPVCEKQLKVSSMWLHRKIHNESERFSCDICGQKFVQKINLIHHTKAHLGEKPFECSQCQMAFPERSHLIKHQRYHTPTREFKCDKCGKMYKTERCLKVHNLVHLEQRPFVCNECNKSFISSSKLKQHSNIHTGERPYKCKYCSRDFTNFPNWLKHIRRRHKVDHKTGELLQSVPNYGSSKTTKSIAKMEKKAKTKVPAKGEMKIETTFTDIHGLSLNSAEELVMQQALEMEESGYLIAAPAGRIIDLEASLPRFDCFSPPASFDVIPELPLSSITSEFQYFTPSVPAITEILPNNQTLTANTTALPSVETLFASSFQKSYAHYKTG